MKRREFLGRMTAGTTFALSAAAHAAPRSTPKAATLARSLVPLAFRPLPLGSIQPAGWLDRQLRLQANGLTGHLDEFWTDVSDSQWFGGKADGWERAPYWLDGFIPLAWSMEAPDLRAKARLRVDQIVAGQRADGSFAPYPADPTKPYDLWSVLLVNKALAQYHDATGDLRVFEAINRSLRSLIELLDRKPLHGWGRYRWYEGLIPTFHVYDRTGEPWLLDLARKFHAQGTDFMAIFAGDDITQPTPRRGLWTWDKHVVNTAMALKAYALSSRFTRNAVEKAFPARMLEILDRHHGQATGMFSGDECLVGRSPTQGTELCAVVEAMFSFEQLLAATGNPMWGDRLERVAFNALPATFAPDMWSHQYVQQVNQVQCTSNPEHMWGTNGPDSNLFGLEPNFGCCTANMHQGWPKFASHLWMRTPEGGIAALAYAPSTARFEVAGAPVQVALDTDYPFRDALRLTVHVERPTRFPLVLRVPSWATGANVRIAGNPAKPLRPGTFHRIAREWRSTTTIELQFPMTAKVTRRYHQATVIERGPLLYSLKIGETRTRINADKPHRELPHGDFEVRPSTPWNYGLDLDDNHPERSLSFEERPVGERPFSPEGAGMIAHARGRRLPQWKLRHGWADEIPPEPQSSKEPVEDITLLPYGCTNLRVTEFPRTSA
jgi:hypothetical protein